MKKEVFCVVAVAMLVMLLGEVEVAKAATCNPQELQPCVPAIISGQPPTSSCCSKLREQAPCLCGYIRNPSLRQYVNSPNARKVASSCGVSVPKC